MNPGFYYVNLKDDSSAFKTLVWYNGINWYTVNLARVEYTELNPENISNAEEIKDTIGIGE